MSKFYNRIEKLLVEMLVDGKPANSPEYRKLSSWQFGQKVQNSKEHKAEAEKFRKEVIRRSRVRKRLTKRLQRTRGVSPDRAKEGANWMMRHR